jgi:TonB-dependent receptor
MFVRERAWTAHRIGWLLLSLLLVSLPAFAQSGKGAISGTIVDRSGSVLKGAQIELLPSGISTSANNQGEFALRDIVAGHYTLSTSYVGFAAHKQEIDVVAGKTLDLIVKLDVASNREEIVVSAERAHGEADAINQTRAADNLIDVLPAEVITSLPNANIADALGRMPGVVLERIEGEGVYVDVRGTEPRLTNVMIDGITIASPEPNIRYVRLDVIPSELVEAVELNKTLSANQDADGIGGSVNLRTKNASDQPLFTVFGIGGYTPISNGRSMDQFGGVFGKRFGENKKFGILTGVTYDYNGRSIDNIQPALDQYSTFAQPFYDSNTLREYRYFRTRYGISGSTDYKFNDKNNIYAHGLYSDLQDYGDKWYYSPISNSLSGPGEAAVQTAINKVDKTPPTFYTSKKSPNASVASMSLGGRHVQQNSWLTWEVSAGRSYEIDSAGNPKADFAWVGSSIPSCNYNPGTRIGDPTFGANCDQAGSPLLNANAWSLADLTTSTGLTSQLNLSAATSYARNYYAGGHFGTFEAGFKIRNAHKSQDATENVYGTSKQALFPTGDSGLLMSSLQGNFEDQEYHPGAKYFGGKFGPVSDFTLAKNYVLQNLSADLDGYKTASASYPNIFHTIERITAGYIMNTIDLGKLHVQTGLRFEATQMDALGYQVTLFKTAKGCANGSATGCGIPSPITNNPSYLDALPSVQLRYPLSQNSVLRAVYSRGIARPDPYQLVPFVTADESKNPIALTAGDPNLKPEHANNYDLLFERYLHPVGMLQAGFFFKQLNAPQIQLSSAPASLFPSSMQSVFNSYASGGVVPPISSYVNGQNAWLYGFEISYQQRLSMLPGAFKGLGLSTNYTYTDSQEKGVPGGRTGSPALIRQAPNTWNFSPTYDTKRVSIRVGFNYSGANIYSYNWFPSKDSSGLGPSGPSGDTYTMAHKQLDAQGSYKVGRGFTVMAYGLNLTNEVFGYYTGSPQFVNQREYYKPTYGGGLRYTFGQDR